MDSATTVDDVVSAYKIVASIPTLSSANIIKSGKSVISYYSVRNLETTSTSKFKYSYTLDDKLQVIAESEFPNEITNEVLSSISPSEKLKAVVRNQTDSTKKQYLEIWFAKSMKQCIDLTALEIHGDVYADVEFASLSWSPDETHVAYIAEKNLPKSEPYIKRSSLKDNKSAGLKDTPTAKGEQYLYKQDWGEQLVGKYLSVIVVCELSNETFTIIQGLPESWCPGQVIWAPDGKSLIGIARETEPRRLGLISCTNRPSFLFNVTLDGKNTILTGAGKAVRSPRFSNDGKTLVWLQRASGGPHHSCQQIVKTKWPLVKQYTYYDYLVSYATLDIWARSTDNTGSTAITTVIDIVQTHVSTVGGELFYGVYSQSLPTKAFVADGVRLAFSTAQKTEIRSYIVNTNTNKIVDISDRTSAGSTSILDITADYILAYKTSFNHPYQLIVAQLPEAGKEHDIKWYTVGDAADIPDIVRTSEVHYMDLKHENSSDLIKDFSAIYFAPTTDKNKTLPLIVWPHGGPHSSSYNAYSLTASLFAYLGFASLQVNFRGSTGSGEATIKYLPGHIGSADVHDCKLAVEKAVSQFPIDQKKIVLFGGSHGGFLVTHLSGQYPDDFAVVVSRNPVIDIASMINTTDIPDWCAVEAGFDFTEKGPVNEMQLLAMRRFSPLTYVQNVKAPTALMLGSNDKRVPFYQGIEYYNRLKANGCTTRLYVYEDNHSLSTLAVEMDNLINGIWWFIQHLQ